MTCIDISPKMNRIAERVKARAQAENMRIITASGAATGLPASSQDKVFVMQTDLPETIHWQPLINEVRRILKKDPRARFVFSFAAKKKQDIDDVLGSVRRNRFDFTALKYASAGNIDAVMVIAKPVLF